MLLYWTVGFAVVAAAAGFYGFDRIALALAAMGQLFFVTFVFAFVVALIMGVFKLSRRGAP